MKWSFTLTLLLVLPGCASPKLTRHYEKVDEASLRHDALTLSVFLANPKTDEDAPLVTKLTERGQAELIRSVAAAMPAQSGPAALLDVLGKAPTPAAGACDWADTTSLTKRVTLAVLGNLGRPADRIDRLAFTFTLAPDQGYRFASWDKFDSVYGSYDLGSAKSTQTRTVNLGANKNALDPTGALEKVLSAGAEASNGLEENMNYTLRHLNVGGALEPLRATLVQEGGPYVNLLGSSSAVFTLKLASTGDPQPVHVLRFKSGVKTAADDVEVERCIAHYPARAADLPLTVAGSAMKRVVLEHGDTLSEGDDAIRFETETLAPVTVTIASRQALKAEFFGLASCRAAKEGDVCLALAIENPESGDVVDRVMLQTAGQAAALRDWLVAHSKAGMAPATLGNRRIGLANAPDQGGGAADTPLSAAMVRTLRVMRLGGNAG